MLKKDLDDYKTKVAYPLKTEFTTLYAYKNGRVVWEGPLTQWNLIDRDNQPDHKTSEKFLDEKAYRRARQAYADDQNRMLKEFQNDLEEEYLVTGHPKADKLFGMAWNRGHAGGLSDVVSEYDELVELIK